MRDDHRRPRTKDTVLLVSDLGSALVLGLHSVRLSGSASASSWKDLRIGYPSTRTRHCTTPNRTTGLSLRRTGRQHKKMRDDHRRARMKDTALPLAPGSLLVLDLQSALEVLLSLLL